MIRPDDDGMLVKSYGTSMWVDRKTGQEKCKCNVHSLQFAMFGNL